MLPLTAFNTRCSLLVIVFELWSPGENNVAVVDARRHKGMHQCRSRLFTECTPDVSKSKTTKMVEGRADVGSMFLETEINDQTNSTGSLFNASLINNHV